jgi:hypothetical protein
MLGGAGGIGGIGGIGLGSGNPGDLFGTLNRVPGAIVGDPSNGAMEFVDGYILNSPSRQPTIGSSSVVTNVTDPPDTEFTHVAVTYNGTELRLYINGGLASSDTHDLPIDSMQTDLLIGRAAASGFGRFQGVIDEIAIYDEALIQARIATHHSIGLDL